MIKPKLGGWRPDSENEDASAIVRLEFDSQKLSIQNSIANASDTVTEIDGVLDLRKWCSPIENQSSLSSCTGNGVVGALEFLLIRTFGRHVDLSRLFTYYNARLLAKEQEKDEGSYISLAFKSLSTIGTCSESTWTYDNSKVLLRPSWLAYQEAFANKIDTFYSISGVGERRIEQIKQALQSFHPVVFGMTVDNDYVNHQGKQPVSMPKKNRPSPGGHCQMIVGYDLNLKCWIVRNSWGTDWGNLGYALVPFSYLDESNASDFWVATLYKHNKQ